MNVLAEQLRNEVHVWTVRIRAEGSVSSEACANAFRPVLSKGELERCDRFHFDNLRHDYTVKHGVQRTLLGQYLEQSPQSIGYEFGAFGKPRVVTSGATLSFNQSDSSELAVFAIAEGLELGVDVEQIRYLQNLKEISAQYFAPEENEELRSLPASAFESGFYKTWTRKEAYVKALGKGLHLPLRSFQVTATGEPRIVHIDGNISESDQWQIHSFFPAHGYLGAVVYRSRRRRLRFFGIFEPSDFLHS